MSDTTIDTATDTPTKDLEPGATPDSDALGGGGVKALKAERDARAAAEKANADLAKKLKALEDRDKSEAERQQEALESAKAELEALTAAKTRAEVAADKAVPTSLLAGPASSSPEDIAAFADALIAFRGEQKQTPSSSAIGRANSSTDLSDPAQALAAAINSAQGR